DRRSAGVELHDRVAPIRAAIPIAVAGGNEDVPVLRIDHRSGTAPDGRLGLMTGIRRHQLMTIAAQRVPYVSEPARAGIEDGHMPLIGWTVAHVAGGDGDHLSVEDLQ